MDKIFDQKDWYLGVEEGERELQGVVEALEVPQVSAGRTHRFCFSLDSGRKYPIYTGTVGGLGEKTVEKHLNQRSLIRGKLVGVKIASHDKMEIWPGTIKEI